MKFPKVDAALAAGDKCQWQIGDALLDEIPIGSAGESNDSQALLEECAEEQERRGRIISWRTLKEYRSVANAFPKEARGSFSWTACRQAGSPEMLRAVQKITGKKLPTTREVDRTRPVVEQHQARQYREEQRKAGIERKPSLKLPRDSKPTIRSEHLGGLRLLGEVLRHSGRLEDARDAIETATNFVRENLTKLDSEETELFTDLAFEIAKKGHKLADVAQRLADRRKKHLTVVGG